MLTSYRIPESLVSLTSFFVVGAVASEFSREAEMRALGVELSRAAGNAVTESESLKRLYRNA